MKGYLPLLALFTLTLTVYLNALSGQFIWDDEDFVYKNIYVRNLSLFPYSLNQNLIAGAGKVSNYYRPLLLFSFSLDWQLWHGKPFGFHLTNILLHASVAILAFFFLNRLFKDQLTAFLAAGFFALHPLQTEAVTYISGRGDPLFATLMLASLLSYLKARHSSFIDPSYLASLVLFMTALLAKELAVVAVPLLILIEICRHPQTLSQAWLKEKGLRILPFLIITGVYLALRLTTLNFANTLNFYGEENLYTQSLNVRLATFSRVLITHLGLILFPKNLHMERTISIITNPLSPVVLLVTLGLGIGLAGAVWFLKKGNLLPLFSLGWFLINLVPTSGIIPINGIIYEHFLYLALLGPFLLFSHFLAQALKKERGSFRKPVMVVIALLWTLLGIRTIIRNSDWHDPITFYTHLLKFSESARVHNNLGMAYVDAGNNLQAIFHYRRAIDLADVYPQTHYNLANSLAALDKTDQAVSSFEEAIKIDPDFAPAYDGLIQLYLDHQQTAKAIEILDQAIKVFPRDNRYPGLRNKIIGGKGRAWLEGFQDRSLELGGFFEENRIDSQHGSPT